MRKARYLDKLIDELAKGRAMEKILRTQAARRCEPAAADALTRSRAYAPPAGSRRDA